MVNKKAVIFDLDGVLVNSQPFHYDVDIATLKAFGANLPLDEAKKLAGMALVDRVNKYIKYFTLTVTPNEIMKLHVTTMLNLLETTVLKPIYGIIDVLLLLKQNGVAMSVASSSSLIFISKMLDKLGISQFFDFIVSGEDMANGKPAPDIFLFSAKKHGFNVSECVVVEDSENGVLAAKAANIFCVGYSNPTSGEQNLSKADIIINNYSQLVENNSWLMEDR